MWSPKATPWNLLLQGGRVKTDQRKMHREFQGTRPSRKWAASREEITDALYEPQECVSESAKA